MSKVLLVQRGSNRFTVKFGFNRYTFDSLEYAVQHILEKNISPEECIIDGQKISWVEFKKSYPHFFI
jgi:hypothetical protein